jgi:hypothetical protein
MQQIAVLNPVTTSTEFTYTLNTSAELDLANYFKNDKLIYLLDADFTNDFEDEAPSIKATFEFELTYKP